jgi:hypothetical protein
MRDSFRVNLVGAVVLAALGSSAGLDAEQRRPPTPAAEPVTVSVATPTASIPAEFAGTWDYNPLESVNILTGRPEQAPRSATQGSNRGGTVVTRGGGSAAGGGRGAGGFSAGGGDFGAPRPPSSGLGLGPTPEMMREQRDMSRDLLEVPEQYTIALGPDAITFTDDLERERTYPTDGRKQKYRLGASEFSARVEWNGTELRKDIEGSLGFRMTEVYFLSPDAKRLFVMIRVGQQNRNRQPSGFNRVYDRVDPSAPAEAVASK